MLSDVEFLEHLRDALNHLYDPNRLQRNPLASLFGVADEVNASTALQRILTDAIASLEPAGNVPSHSRAWRIYDLLFCRYVQQLSVEAVADQLGMGVRHLRREQHDALIALAERLRKQYNLETLHQANAGVTRPQQSDLGWNSPTIADELAWLKNTALEQPTRLGPALATVLALVEPLAVEHHVHLDIS